MVQNTCYIGLIGTNGVGKNSLLKSVNYEEETNRSLRFYKTIGHYTIDKKFNHSNGDRTHVFTKVINLSYRRNRELTPNTIKDCEYLIFAFDLSREHTFDDIKKYLNNDFGLKQILIGCKSDLIHKVTEEEIKSFQIPYYENSLIDNKFPQIFQKILTELEIRQD